VLRAYPIIVRARDLCVGGEAGCGRESAGAGRRCGRCRLAGIEV